jgi:endonuclease/exonuclease/phosphatase family metal-dependent hydrolase
VNNTWRFATWNLDHRHRNPRRRSPWHLIRDARADVVALQEVQGREIELIRREHSGPSLFTQELYESANLRWIGSGLLLTEGAEVLEAGVFPELPKPQRGVWAQVELPDHGQITAVSWHTPNAAGDGRRTKMAAYRAMSEWLVKAPHPLVLGADLNTWHDPVDLGTAEPGDAYFDEHEFVGLDPRHGLVDAYRAVLERQGRLEGLRASAPPLAVSHVLSSGVGHRMDRIFVSADLVPLDGDYWHADAVEAGSDHALHWIELESQRAGSRTRSTIRAS